MSASEGGPEGVEIFGLTVLELRKLESELSKEGVKPKPSPATAAFNEPGLVAVALTLTPVVVTGLVAILMIPRARRKKEVRLVHHDPTGGRTEIVVKESDYSNGTLTPEALKALSGFFNMDVGKVIAKILGGKE